MRRSRAKYSADGQVYTLSRVPFIGSQTVCDIALSGGGLRRQIISSITINREEFTNVPMYEWVAVGDEDFNGRWFAAGGHYYVLYNSDQTGGGWRVAELLEMPELDKNNNVVLKLKYVLQNEDIEEIEVAQNKTEFYLSPVSFEIPAEDTQIIRFMKYERQKKRSLIFV